MSDYEQILRLNAQFSWLIDHKNGEGVPDLFTDDGYYGFENQGATGREEIKAFYDMRKARGHRVSRHIFSPVCIHEETADRITGTTMLTLIAADGEGPHPADIHVITDYRDEYVKVDGEWKYKSRVIDPIFGDIPDLQVKQ